jgi:hypothetical protein
MGTDYLECFGLKGKIIIIKCVINKQDEVAWAGLRWLKIQTRGGLLQTR